MNFNFLNRRTATAKTSEYFDAISSNNAEKIHELLLTGINVNTINSQGVTGLILAAMKGNLEVVVELLNHPAIDIQYIKKGFGNALNAAVFYPAKDKIQKHVDIIRLLLQHGIHETIKNRANNTPLEIARTTLHEALPLLERNIWKGKSQGDLAGFESLFEEKHPFDVLSSYTSICPVCITTVVRTKDDYCKFVGHYCPDITPHFNKDLYKKYHKDGKIKWCVSCNRIVSDHTHYNLSYHDAEPPKINYHESCGELPEKLIHINAFRNKIFELQSKINYITTKDAIKQITEAAWDAPLEEKKLLTEWEIPLSSFIEITDDTDIVFLYTGKKYEGKFPILTESVNAMNASTLEKLPFYILFQHTDPHPFIGFKSLFDHLMKNMLAESKLICFCTEFEIHPDELQYIHDTHNEEAFNFPASGYNRNLFQQLINDYKKLYFGRKNALESEDGALVGGGGAQAVGGAGSKTRRHRRGSNGQKTRRALKRTQHRRCRKNS